MKTKKHNLIENKEAIKQAFEALAQCKLTNKEKQTLNFFSKRKLAVNTTQLAKELTIYLNCKESTVWSVLRSLRKLRLIDDAKGFLEISNEGNIAIGGKDD